MLETVVEAPESEPIPTLTLSSPNPTTPAVPETTSIANPVSKNETSFAVKSFVECMPVAVFVKRPVLIASTPWLTMD